MTELTIGGVWLAVAALLTYLGGRLGDDDGFVVTFAIMWPLTMPVFGLVWFFSWLYRLGRRT